MRSSQSRNALSCEFKGGQGEQIKGQTEGERGFKAAAPLCKPVGQDLAKRTLRTGNVLSESDLQPKG